MATLDWSALVVALPKIAREFDAVVTDVEWVLVAYNLTIGTLLLPFGRIGDYWGKFKFFKLGFILFVLSSVLCAFSQTVFQLILFRAIQGIGAAIYASVGPAILVSSFPARERGKAVGFMGTVVSLGLMLGPPIGGLLTHYFSWRAIFLLNIPVGIVGLIWVFKYLREDTVEKHEFKFDFPGAITCMIASASLLIVMSRITVWGAQSPTIWALMALFVVSALLFIKFEKRNPHGILDLAMFKHKYFTFSYLTLLMHMIAIHMVYFLIPFYLAEILLFSQNKVGWMMLAMPMTFALFNPVSGWLSDRIGTRLLVPLGLFVGSIAYVQISTFSETSVTHIVFVSLLLLGVSIGIFQAPMTSGVMGWIHRERLGTASALIAAMRNYGSVMGVALATMIFTLRVNAHNGFTETFSIHEIPSGLFVLAFHDTLWGAATIVCIGIVFSFLRGADPKHLRATDTYGARSYPSPER